VIHRYRVYYGAILLFVVFWASMFSMQLVHLQTDKALIIRPKTAVIHITRQPVSVGSQLQAPPQSSAAPIAQTSTASQFATTPSWSQDFSSMPDGALDGNTWNYDIGNGPAGNAGWGNNEQEYYTSNPDNVGIVKGQLVIEAQQQSMDGFSYTSARIKTMPSLNFTYGKIDIVAKLPAGAGTWPALWLLPSTSRYELTTPAGEADPNNWLRDGEIDIMEASGLYPGQISSSAQSYTYNPGNNNERGAVENISDYATAFHDYELEWTPTSLTFLVDGVAYHTVTKAPTDTSNEWPYNQPFYLIMNIAMGGTDGGPIDNSSGPWLMNVKSINYYPYTGV
jgi:beta-glucanase (GH16 family)